MKYSDEQIERARSVPIATIAKNLGYTVRKLGRYYTLKEIDSIRIYPKKNDYRRYSEDTGSDSIEFVMQFTGKTFVEAVKYLLDGEDPEVPAQKTASLEPEKPAVKHYAAIPSEVIDKLSIDALGVYAKLRNRMNWDKEPKEYKLPRHSPVTLYQGQACVGIRGEFSKETGLTRERLERILRGFQEDGLILITRVNGQCSVVTFPDYAEPQTIRAVEARIEKEALEKKLNSADPWLKRTKKDTTFDTTKTLMPTTKIDDQDTTFDTRTNIIANKVDVDTIPVSQYRDDIEGETVLLSREKISELTKNPVLQLELLELIDGKGDDVPIARADVDRILGVSDR